MSDNKFNPDKKALEDAIEKGLTPSESFTLNPPALKNSTFNGEISLAREWGWGGGGWGNAVDIPQDVIDVIRLDDISLAREWGWGGGGWGTKVNPVSSKKLDKNTVTLAREWGWGGGW